MVQLLKAIHAIIKIIILEFQGKLNNSSQFNYEGGALCTKGLSTVALLVVPYLDLATQLCSSLIYVYTT